LTLFGRRCRTAEINSTNYALRQFAERAAVNATLQGSAADILKRAMIALEHFIASRGLESQIILQIHDEIVVEAPDGEVEVMRDALKRSMESAAEIRAPLEASARVGGNLLDLG
jgi:DNA polymerase-1